MERSKLKLGILTSTRADFGIYQPLLQELTTSFSDIDLELIVFGTHLSPFHGYTLREIEEFGSFTIHKVFGMPLSDTPQAIAKGYGHLVSAFSQFWAEHTYDWVLALGDRYEMSAAVQAGIPLGVNFAHLHGGETTLGAIDNIYRHQISLAAKLHFVATETFAERVREITHSRAVHTVGALSLAGLQTLSLPDWHSTQERFSLPVDTFALITFHPETIAYQDNEAYSRIAQQALARLAQQIPVIITLPNADTAGSLYRLAFKELQEKQPEQVFLVESFGKLHYFGAMRQAAFLLGNTSSGIIEAASFGKYVVNVGDRQKGRPQSRNTFDASFNLDAIESACTKALSAGVYTGENIYQRPDTAIKIIEHLLHASL